MTCLDKCDALLDIHSSNNPNTTPFIITDNGHHVVKNMNFKIVAQGFDDIEPGGTDGYMYRNNKIGICVECGYAKDGEKNLDVAYDSIIQFLQYYESIDKMREPNNIKQKILNVDEVVIVPNENFKLVRDFDDFEEIKKGTLIATEGEKKYIADKDRVILFGIKDCKVGTEAYILGNWIKKTIYYF
jgi:succinylglutamate desuccinylase